MEAIILTPDMEVFQPEDIKATLTPEIEATWKPY